MTTMSPSFISHELYLIYDPLTELGRKTHALALSVNSVVHEINIMDKTITPLHWKEIIGMLDETREKILNTEHPDYARFFLNNNFSEQDFLEILFQNPQLVKGPIGILHNKAVICSNQTDILKLDLTPGAEKKSYTF
jgi:arsenate reductase (glutaredoxin)